MRLHIRVFLALILVSPLAAQQYAGPDVFATLTDQPATHTGFTLDRDMMQAAQGILEQNGLDPQRAAAAIKGVSFDTYRYRQPAFYTPDAMAAIVADFNRTGWKHLVNASQSTPNPAQPKSAVTDLWLHFAGADIDGVTVLTRAPKEMTVVHLTCDLRPLDLLHLSGHFGIPRVDPSAVMVPAPAGR